MTVQQLIFLPILIPVLLACYLLYYLVKRQGPFDAVLAIIIATGGLWCAGYIVECSVSDFKTKVWVVRFEYFAYVMGPIGLFLLGLQMQDRIHLLGKKGIAALLIVPVLTLVQVFTSDYHDVFWSSKQLVEYKGLTFFESTYGPGFWLHIVYSYTLNLIGALLIFSAMFESGQYYKRQRIALTVAVVLPWIANIFYIFRLSGTPFDPSPFAMVISGFILVMGVFRFGLGDLVPVARAKVLADMKEGVMVLDNQMRVVDFNQAVAQLFDFENIAVGQKASELFEAHPKLMRLLERQQESTELIYTGVGDRVHRINSELLNDKNHSRLLTIHDLSADSKIQDALRLVVEGTSFDVGEDFYRSLTRSLSLALNTRFAMVGILNADDADSIETLAFWNANSYLDNFAYTLAGSPIEEVVQGKTNFYPEGVATLFPQDKCLTELNIEGYLGTPLSNHAGEILGVLIVMDDKPFKNTDLGKSLLDIFADRAAAEIERRTNEKRIAASEQNYRRIVETTEDGVCVTDANGFIEFSNQQMATLIGGDQQFVLSKKLWSLLDVAESEHRYTENGRVECEITNLNGRKYWVRIAKRMINETSGLLYLFSDVSDEKRLEESNQRIEQQLHHAQKLESLGVLAGGVAHDFNNLLMPILGYLDLIRQKVGDDVVVSDYVNRIQHAGGKLADLCNQMLTYAGKGHFIETDINVSRQFEDMQQLMRASVPRSFSIEYRLEPELDLIRADATQLNQIIMNLLINAAEAMSEKSAGQIIITTGEEVIGTEALESLHYGDKLALGEYVFLDVEDEGIGLKEEDAARLFEPFYTTKFTGRGLGMAVVYGIVRSHRGAIRIVSKPGSGTRIRVLFPKIETRMEHENALPDTISEREDASLGKVLVVDDEEYVRDLVRNMLESIGFEVLEAKDGSEGLALFSGQQDLNVCVIDVTMPGMGGIELARKIREQNASVPVLLVSGYSQQDVRDGKLGAENIKFLQKPFTIDQIKLAIDSAKQMTIH